jgi:hypothetical protein
VTIPPSRTPTDPGIHQADRSAEILLALTGLTKAIEESGQKRSWLERNQALTIAIVGAIFVVFQFAGQHYFQASVGQYIDPRLRKTEERLEAVEGKAESNRISNNVDHLTLRQNDADLAVYVLSTERHDRRLLERVARKLRVELEDHPETLSEAEDRVKAVRDGARAPRLN